LIGWIVLILSILVVLAVVGLGWDTFFSGVMKGAEKISNLAEVKNLTDKAKSEFDNIVGNSTVDIIAIF
jgi:Tfp pilus assembly protein PilO